MSTTISPATGPRPLAARGPRPSISASLRRFSRSPKGYMTLALLLLLALAAPRVGLGLVAPGLVAAVLVATLLDAVLLRLTGGAWELPSGALLSALFVALILSPQEPWYVVVCAATVAVNSKWIFRTRWSNIFNPAAFALVAAALLFASGQSWWGALPDLPLPSIVVLLAAALYVARRVNKLPMVVAFAGAYFAIFTVASFVGDPAQFAEVFRVPDINMAIFFAGFMLTDPPTSPIRPRDQVIYALIVAVASAIIFIVSGAVYFLPAGLLVGNAWEAGRRVLTGRRQERARQGRVVTPRA